MGFMFIIILGVGTLGLTIVPPLMWKRWEASNADHSILTPEIRCRGCGYDLSGLRRAGECPECGKPYGTVRVVPDATRVFGDERPRLVFVWGAASLPVVVGLVQGLVLGRPLLSVSVLVPGTILAILLWLLSGYTTTRELRRFAITAALVTTAFVVFGMSISATDDLVRATFALALPIPAIGLALWLAFATLFIHPPKGR